MSKPVKFPVTLPPTAPMLKAIGLVAIQWGFLEFYVDQEIKRLLKIRGSIPEKFTFRFSFRKRAKAWRQMARHHLEPDLVAEVLDISKRATAIKPKRDAVIHGVYGRGVDAFHLLIARHAEAVEYGPISLAEIMEMAQEISAINQALSEHSHKIIRRYVIGHPELALRWSESK